MEKTKLIRRKFRRMGIWCCEGECEWNKPYSIRLEKANSFEFNSNIFAKKKFAVDCFVVGKN